MTNKDKAFIAVVALLLLCLAILSYRVFKVEESNPTREFLQEKQDSLMREVRRTQRIVNDLKVELSLHDDTIKIIERRIPIITNKYYENEKVYLTASDSVNRELRVRNQVLFERYYFNGRFSPKTK